MSSTSLRPQALSLLLMRNADAKAAAVRALLPVYALSLAETQAVLAEPPGVPGRPERPELRAPSATKSRAVGTPEGRAGLLHALAHIANNAIAVALDVLWRVDGMPEAFYPAWLHVAP